jgi:pimeloyl-ACP methyl ester carboxylesterase
MIITANDISVNYEIIGEGENLVLIHGAIDNLNMWHRQIPTFSKSFRVITYDVRGHGKTESPETEYSIPLFAEDLYLFMKAIDVEKAFFLGFSMGGRIALQLGIDHAEMVKALILANSSLGLKPPSSEFLDRRRLWQELLRKGDTGAFIEMMTINAFSPGFDERKPTEFEKYRNIKLQNKSSAFAQVMQALAALAAPPDLSRVKCPVLLIVGINDAYMGVDQGHLAQRAIIGSELVILPAGHAAAIETPDEFNAAVMAFIRECRVKSG